MGKSKRIVIKSIEERDNLARAIQAFDKKHGITPYRSPRLAREGRKITGAMSTPEAVCRSFNGNEELSVETLMERVAELKGIAVARPLLRKVIFELSERKKIQRTGKGRYRKAPTQ